MKDKKKADFESEYRRNGETDWTVESAQKVKDSHCLAKHDLASKATSRII